MALTISVPMPVRLTHYVLCAAIESSCGSHYWLCDYLPRSQLNADEFDYVALHIGVPKDADGLQVPKHSRIGASRIAAALSAMLASERNAERAGRVIAGNFDAPDADIVLQFAAFGKVIYG